MTAPPAVQLLGSTSLIPSQGNKHLYEVFPWWNKPQELAAGYEESIERTSGGFIQIDIVEWRNINDIPVFVDGNHYTADQYYQNRLTNTGWDMGPDATADVRKIFRDQAIAPLVDAGLVDEVWFFGDHYFSIGGESFMAGPGAFFINGPVFSDVAAARPFACYGFSYEREVALMLHNTGHRIENHGSRTWGSWSIPNPPVTNWDKFSANAFQFAGFSGAGTCHYPANGVSDYDYGNVNFVQSWVTLNSPGPFDPSIAPHGPKGRILIIIATIWNGTATTFHGPRASTPMVGKTTGGNTFMIR